MRDLVAESHLRVDDLIAPLFVREGIDEPQPIASLPGVVQHTRASLRDEVAELAGAGRPVGDPVRRARAQGCRRAAAPTTPTASCSSPWRDLRADLGDDLVVMADLCVDEYTDHGHCGIVDEHGVVDNDATLEHLRRGCRGPGARRCPRRRAERDDGRPGRRRSAPRSTPTATTTSRSSPTPPSTPARCTARSATRSTSRSSAAATARATSRTGATPAKRAGRSRSTSPRVPTW